MKRVIFTLMEVVLGKILMFIKEGKEKCVTKLEKKGDNLIRNHTFKLITATGKRKEFERKNFCFFFLHRRIFMCVRPFYTF